MRSVVVVVPLLCGAVLFACKGDGKCEAHCGPCGGDPPLADSVISPVRYGSDTHGVPVIELLYEPEATCPGEGTTSWLRWKDGALALGPAGDDLNTDTADLEYLTDLHSEAIVWHNADLIVPYDKTLGAFRFTVIVKGETVGSFRCRPGEDGLICLSAK